MTDLLTIREAAKLLRCDTSRLYTAIRAGKLRPAAGIGVRSDPYLVRREDVLALRSEGAARPTRRYLPGETDARKITGRYWREVFAADLRPLPRPLRSALEAVLAELDAQGVGPFDNLVLALREVLADLDPEVAERARAVLGHIRRQDRARVRRRARVAA